jgi:hypothetical protein
MASVDEIDNSWNRLFKLPSDGQIGLFIGAGWQRGL